MICTDGGADDGSLDGASVTATDGSALALGELDAAMPPPRPITPVRNSTATATRARPTSPPPTATGVETGSRGPDDTGAGPTGWVAIGTSSVAQRRQKTRSGSFAVPQEGQMTWPGSTAAGSW